MTSFWLAIDPGDVHVGWASYYNLFGASEFRAGTMTPTQAIDKVRSELRWMSGCDRELIVEEFVLYPNVNQAFSPMKTSQMIGALKLIARDEGVPVVEQGATIKKSTRAQLPARGIKQIGETIHARDAELHLYYRLLREKVL